MTTLISRLWRPRFGVTAFALVVVVAGASPSAVWLDDSSMCDLPTPARRFGQLLRSLGNGQRPPGLSEFGWDGLTDVGTEARTGIYYLRAEVGAWRTTKSLLLVR